MALGGGDMDELLATIPTAAPEGDAEEDGDYVGMESCMADLSVALSKNQPQAAAEAFKRAVQIAMEDMEP